MSIPEINKQTKINIDEEISSLVKTDFIIKDALGFGGGGIVFKVTMSTDIKELSLKNGQDIAIKICDPLLTYQGCIEFKNEAANTDLFSSLNIKKLCYNYPIVYGFYYRCIFFNPKQVKDIIEYIESNNIDKGKDAFILYCCCPKYIDLNEIDNTIIPYLLSSIDSNILLGGRNKLPKTDNIKGLYLLSKRKEEEMKWTSNDNLYEYLDLLQDTKCDMFLLLQYLDGQTLDSLKKRNPRFKLDNSIFFELVYSTAISIYEIEKQQEDMNDTNAMIVKTKNPRIYSYKNKIYIIEGPMFYFIDFAKMSNKKFKTLVKSDFKYKNFYTEEQTLLLNKIFSEGTPTIENFLNTLFEWISDRIKTIDNKQDIIDYILVNYNYRLIKVDDIFE